MYAWLLILVLTVAEFVAIRWWLNRQVYPFFFNDWAPFLYTALVTINVAIGWLVSTVYEPGGTGGLQLMLVIMGALTIVVLLGTLFLRWVVRLDMTDISDKEQK
jgi:hypothetical protein